MNNDATLPCELCEEPIPTEAQQCPACKALRKPCPFCRKPFWQGAEKCPHCGKDKPSPETWSLP